MFLRLSLIISTFFIFSLFKTLNIEVAHAQNLANCLKMTLTTQVVQGQWPGGSISVSCPGDNGPNCKGTNTSVTPGGSVNLNNCSCPPYASGCINIPNSDITSKGCTSELVGPYCGTNGNSINPTLRISCPTPPPACPGGAALCGNHLGTNVSCPPGQVPDWERNQGYDDWCSLPGNGGGPRPYCYRCIQAPTNTPSPTSSPTPPTNPTATPTSPPGGSPTSTPPPGITPPTATPTRIPSPTNTPSPSATPTRAPTPTPDFNESMCKCEDLNVDESQLALGATAKVTATGKVEGTDTTKAKITKFRFNWFEGDVNAKRNGPFDRDAVRTENSANLVRYQSEFDWQIPSNLDTSITYRVQAVPVCEREIASAPVNRAVLAETDSNVGFFARIWGFFTNLFGGGSSTQDQGNQIANVNQTATPTTNPNLQLGELVTGEVIEKGVDPLTNCSFLRVRFGLQN